jgi:hypothetical protein
MGLGGRGFWQVMHMRENLGDFAARLAAFLFAAASFFHGALLRGEE